MIAKPKNLVYRILNNPPNQITRPLLIPAKKINDKLVELTTGLLPIKRSMPQDVFIVGYPKSGNTWLQNIISGLVYYLDPEFGYDSIIQDLVPDVHAKRYYRRYKNTCFFKSHALPDKRYRKVIYILRDGRDCMVSYWRMKQASSDKSLNFDDFLQSNLFPGKWHIHVDSWMKNPYEAQLLLIKYEDLLIKPVAELLRICTFLEIERSEYQLKLLSEKTSFLSMSRKEKTSGFSQPIMKKVGSSGASFVRKGIPGGYKNEIPLASISFMTQEFESTLIKYGYTLE